MVCRLYIIRTAFPSPLKSYENNLKNRALE